MTVIFAWLFLIAVFAFFAAGFIAFARRDKNFTYTKPVYFQEQVSEQTVIPVDTLVVDLPTKKKKGKDKDKEELTA